MRGYSVAGGKPYGECRTMSGFVATEDLVEKKKLKRPRSKTFEALEKRSMIFQGRTDYDCSLTEKGRRAFEAI